MFSVKTNVFIGKAGSRRSGANRTGNQRVAQERASGGCSISSAPSAGSSTSPSISCRRLTEPGLWKRAGAASATEPLGPRSERHSLSKGSFWRTSSSRSLWGSSIKRKNNSSSQPITKTSQTQNTPFGTPALPASSDPFGASDPWGSSAPATSKPEQSAPKAADPFGDAFGSSAAPVAAPVSSAADPFGAPAASDPFGSAAPAAQPTAATGADPFGASDPFGGSPSKTKMRMKMLKL